MCRRFDPGPDHFQNYPPKQGYLLPAEGRQCGKVDCMVALPGQLFYSTQIPVCLWFIAKSKLPTPVGRRAGGEGMSRDRRGETLFIDARNSAPSSTASTAS